MISQSAVRVWLPNDNITYLCSAFRFTLNAVDSRGSNSESSFVSVRTSCPMVDDSRAEGTLTLCISLLLFPHPTGLFKNHPEILQLKLKSVSFLSSGVWQIVGFEDNESTGIVGISGSIDWPHWLMFGSKNPDISATSPLISFLYLSLYWSATQSQWSLTLICLFCSLTLLKLSLHPPLDVSSQR